MTIRSADRAVLAAVKATAAALDPPDADLALVKVAETIAETIDAMGPGERLSLLPQHTGQLVKVLGELEARAAKRRALVPAVPEAKAPVSPLDELRRAHARRVARR